ncbi:type III secretion system export apparatus subunit SctU [Bordetella sp. 02P26C-1]|uniref:type III secretion system export apparatus subunit SctU n=1 Tax=Bordetella sp. 02P26C-1 TaxID=2683195 RepID=UPI001354808D|nr:type III secretion system export apparatus subunit SctU [Bordetella sp. 02P26C-1]MVW78591.1 EscU/YscU/HrcU family type III secretion system export apparatus switch protein [Bordetella sp. 02P26C-1]
MSGEKTEQPTHKRLRDSRKKGDVAHSKDFTQTLLILALFGYMIFNAGDITESLGRLILIPADLTSMPFLDALPTAMTAALQEALTLVLPFVLIVLLVGMLSEFLQVGVVIAFEKLKPSGKKLNAIANLKNMFSKKNLVESLKSLIKVVFLTTLITLVIKKDLPELMAMPRAGLEALGEAIGALMLTLLLNVALVYVIIALADLVWQRKQYRKGLMMTKDEVKREYKESEGDPHIKHKRKHLHQEMAMQGGAPARKPTVVITNPTHLAIALYYQKGETPLPKVVAKGEGINAERIKREAREAGVPVMENVPLARSLWRSTEIDQFIPSELIEPVAEVLLLVQRLAQEREEK